MTKFIFISFIFIISCSVADPIRNQKGDKNFVTYFDFKDLSGQYKVKREVSLSAKQINLRQTLFSPGQENKPLEKTVTISKLGAVKVSGKNKLAIIPYASQHSIWFEQKQFFSQLKINMQKRGLSIYLKSPEEKWKGNRFKSLPKARLFCWFSQVSECIKLLLKSDQKSQKSKNFFIVWDSFPYYNEQLQNVSGEVYSKASVKYDGVFQNTNRYAVSLENQVIFYHFDYDFNFEKMVWISQGIIMSKINTSTR